MMFPKSEFTVVGKDRKCRNRPLRHRGSTHPDPRDGQSYFFWRFEERRSAQEFVVYGTRRLSGPSQERGFMTICTLGLVNTSEQPGVQRLNEG